MCGDTLVGGPSGAHDGSSGRNSLDTGCVMLGRGFSASVFSSVNEDKSNNVPLIELMRD